MATAENYRTRALALEDSCDIDTADYLRAAADTIEALIAAMPLLESAESNASGNPDFDRVGPIVASCRSALKSVEIA